MSTFLSICKFVLPLLSQLIGIILTAKASHESGKASTAEYSAVQQAGPVYGQGALGLALLGGGTAAQVVLHQKDKATAKAEPPVAPDGLDQTMHLLNLCQTQMNADQTATYEQLSTINLLVKLRRFPDKKDRVMNAGGGTVGE